MKARANCEKKINHDSNPTGPPTEDSQNGELGFYIVGIGASAGGLESLEQFFTNMPSDSKLAFVVIQHLSPDYKSFMPELLSKHEEMKVYQIQNEMDIQPGCVYVNPPGYNVTIINSRFALTAHESAHKVNLTVDRFFESLALTQNEKSIGVILSGTGSDGTHGCRAIKEAGGLILVQDEKSAKFNGMPKSVISTRVYDYILAPHKMPDIILKYTDQTSLIVGNYLEEEKPKEGKDLLTQIFYLIHKKYSIDFSLYKQNTVLRCLGRRMRICQQSTLEEYVSYLEDNINEIDNFYNSLLIGITRFFRDKAAFESIKSKVIPEILKNKENNSQIRIWVAGCSTGEEAYSLAILFKEYMDDCQKDFNIKIFATDIDSNAIKYASTGIYPESIAEDVSSERLSRFFIKKNDEYQVTKNIREMVVFSIHNVINNPPFFKIDLLTCRNLLIYFKPQLQARVLSTFQFALETSGFLFLGTSENTGEMRDCFLTVDAEWKIFRNKASNNRALINNFSVISVAGKVMSLNTREDYLRSVSRRNWEKEDIYAQLIEQCLPSSILVDEYGELVQVCGAADRFLKVPRGMATNDVQKMVTKELSAAIGTVISKVSKEKRTVTCANIRTSQGSESVTINLNAKPLFTKKSGLLVLIEFDETKCSDTQGDWVENFDTIGKQHERINDLEQELQYTKENLQTSVEEIETSSEELQSANEELLVSNEELHSTNEELQSVNEELVAVNTRYQFKIQELADLNNDMTNFINSTSVGTIFLDADLCIRKFTPAVTKEINLIEQDINRPISHLSHNLIGEDIIMTSTEVMESLIPVEREVKSVNNKWYIIKYTPYRTNENIIKGVVISLIDITSRKIAEESLLNSKLRYEKLINVSPYAMFLVKDNIIQLTNLEGANIFRANKLDQLIGKPIAEYLDTDAILLANNKTESLCNENGQVIAMDHKIIRGDGSEIYVEIIMTPFSFEDGQYDLIILMDVSQRKLSEALHAENIESKRLLDEALAFEEIKNEFFSNLSHELRTPLNVIMSTLQLMEGQIESITKADKVDKMKKHLRIMKQNCYRQLRLVNNMIDITKIDSGFYDLDLQNLDIVQVIENITMSVSEYIKSKSINLIFDTDTESRIIAFDPDIIERIMLNLLSNAVKFSKEGGTIHVHIQNTDEEVIIFVKDNGIGIPEDKKSLIFERFRQVDRSLTRNREGSGIGLSLVKSLVRMHGGVISVQSSHGLGTTFIFSLPAKTIQDEKEIQDEKKPKSNIEKIHLEFSDIYSIS